MLYCLCDGLTPNPPQNTSLWAIRPPCNKNQKRLPMNGKIIGERFYPYKNDTKECKKQGFSVYGLMFADTKEEAIQMFNLPADSECPVFKQD